MNRRHLLARAGAMMPLTAFAALAACSKEESAAPAAVAATPTSAAPAAKGSLTPAQAFDLAKTGSGFTIGPVMAANTVYVFFDPQCPHCAELWHVASEVGSRFRMQWMPVAFLAKISQSQGAAIMTSKDPQATMNEHEQLLMARKGGLDVSKLNVPQDALDKVKANTDLLNKLGADSVPSLYFKNQKTGEYGSHSGALPLQQLLEMVGAA